ncbi:MAG TPA: ion channel [Streptosporangiaceae bacterium]|nr:ion channel [Streptosporangiaceae bacterium]
MTTRAEQRTMLIRSGRGSGERFGGLLLILVFTYLLSAFTASWLVSAGQVVLFLAVLLLALRTGRLQRQTVRVIAIGVLTGSVIAVTLALADHSGPGAGVASLWTALVLLLSVIFIVRRVLSEPEVTLQSIYGAISAYMIIGLMFAAVYSAMYRFGGDTFFAHGSPGDTRTFQYFSFTTLTTLGYGDFTAGGSGGRAVAVIEAMVGQIFLATLVARLVAAFRGPRLPAGPAPEQASPEQASPEQDSRAAPQARQDRRAAIKAARAPGMIRLRPPGTARRRPGSAPRPGGRNQAGQSPDPATRRGARHG